MAKNAINWFEIPVSDLARARNFYKELLGLELVDMPMPNLEMAAFPMVQGGEGATGALVKSENHTPSTEGTVVYFACKDVNEQLEKIESIGGKAMGSKISIGDYGFIAHIMDTEGNHIALHSEK